MRCVAPLALVVVGACGDGKTDSVQVGYRGTAMEQPYDRGDLKAKFADLGATAWWNTPAATLAYRDAEEARLAPIIKASGARVE